MKLVPGPLTHFEAEGELPSPGAAGSRGSHLCDGTPFCLGKAGTATSAMSEKVRTRLEELDDFEEVSEQVVG